MWTMSAVCGPHSRTVVVPANTHQRPTKVETTGATWDYETLISRLFRLRDQKSGSASALVCAVVKGTSANTKW